MAGRAARQPDGAGCLSCSRNRTLPFRSDRIICCRMSLAQEEYVANEEQIGNVDPKTVDSFGDEWGKFDQSTLSEREISELFDRYFKIFPWDVISPESCGFDMGCGTGRWAKLVANRVGHLTCIDPSKAALDVARRNLDKCNNVTFENAGVDSSSLAEGSQDFGYSLGVLHHIPDTEIALRDCVRKLKPGSPFLVYIYYRFDNRPVWFRWLWRASDFLRRGINRIPPTLKNVTTDIIAALVYWPLARFARISEIFVRDVDVFPLSAYRHRSFYTMRTDSRDRFGTPLEQRFTKEEIYKMMTHAGLENIRFSDSEPYWCAVGFRARS